MFFSPLRVANEAMDVSDKLFVYRDYDCCVGRNWNDSVTVEAEHKWFFYSIRHIHTERL
jgi:hypothetical protein